MFLTKENNIKWNVIGYAGIITIVLVLLGIFWFDKPLYLFMRNFDFKLWGLFNAVFDAKNWLIVSAVVMLFFYLKKIWKQKPSYKDEKSKFNLLVFCKDIFHKVRNSYAFYVFCSVLTAGVIGKVLKIIIGRARPIFYEALDMTGFFPFSTDWAFNSMPSGHTFASFAGLVMLGLLAPKIKWFTWSLAIIIGLSRVCYGAHWPTDVILGAFIGMVTADLVKAALKSKLVDGKKQLL